MAPPAHLGRRAYCRRNFVASAAAASIASYGLGRSLPARAQGDIDETLPALYANRADAEALLQEVIFKIDPSFDDETADRIAQRHYELRFGLASILYPLSEPSQVMLVDSNYTQIALIMSSYEDVQLIPPPDEITKIDINEISASLESTPCDRYRAIFFLVLDIIGLGKDYQDVLVELIRDTPVQTTLEQLVDGYPNRDWEKTAKQIVDVLLAIAGIEFVVRLRKALGDQVVKVMLGRMSLYLVPYAGYVYATIVICASIKKNWELLVC